MCTLNEHFFQLSADLKKELRRFRFPVGEWSGPVLRVDGCQKAGFDALSFQVWGLDRLARLARWGRRIYRSPGKADSDALSFRDVRLIAGGWSDLRSNLLAIHCEICMLLIIEKG